MSIECYYHWCQHHSQDEPFCSLCDCVARPDEIFDFAKLRCEELKNSSPSYQQQQACKEVDVDLEEPK